MHLLKTISCFVCLGIYVQHIYAQAGKPADLSINKFLFNTMQFIKTDTGIIINHYYKQACKSYSVKARFIRNDSLMPAPLIAITTEEPGVPKFITIHGNVAYDFFYRSKLDTPIVQENFQQHTERVNLSILIKEKYPLKLVFVLRQSNSPYFRNFGDINFQFDRSGYQKNIQQNLINQLAKQLNEKNDIQALKELADAKLKQYGQLKNWLESPATLQEIIEERERVYFKQVNQHGQPDTLITLPADLNPVAGFKFNMATKAAYGIASLANNSDSMAASFSQEYDTKKRHLDSLEKEVKALNDRADSMSLGVQKKLSLVKQKIYKATNEKELLKIADDNGIAAGKRTGFERGLFAIKRFSIGRSMVDYTELTAKDITISGVNMEYQPSCYVAFAAGKIDYRFRDFLDKNTRNTGQYLVLGRVGIGDLDRRALVLTVFRGSKNTAGYGLPDTVTNQINLLGYSLESIFKKGANTSISFELAKSTKPITGNFQSNKQVNALWKFADRTNLGINIKATTIIAATQTRLSGFFRKTGEHFQSFSLFSYNTDQTAWLASAGQYLFKEKVSITGMLRRNDFTNPFTEKTYKTSTVFKSLTINIRIPKYPSLSFGYYPGSQLYVVNKEIIRENVYYILNGSFVYSYFHKAIGMNSSFIYNQYFNQATDSGFVLYKGTNLYAMQTVFLKKMQLQAGFALNKQPQLRYYTIEISADYSIKKIVKIGAGGKLNKLHNGDIYWGKRILLAADFKHVGSLQFQFEKSYLPTISQVLYPVEIGRVSWYKNF